MPSRFQPGELKFLSHEEEVVPKSNVCDRNSQLRSFHGGQSSSISTVLSPRKRRASWSTRPNTPPKRPRFERASSVPLMSETPVIFKPRLGENIAQWMQAGSGGPLSVLLNAYPIQQSILKHLTNRDILNLITADSSSRRTLQETLKCHPGSDPAEYCFPAPNPVSGLCSTFDFPAPDGRPRSGGFYSFDKPSNAYSHREARLKIPKNLRRSPESIPKPTALTDVQSAPYYCPKEWFWCRRAKCPNLGTDKVPCIECETRNATSTYMCMDDSGWKPVCGSCNKKAKERFPLGYWSCKCQEAIQKQTCTPCIDRLLVEWEREAELKLKDWPTGEWETCPCGKLIDGKDQELYREEFYDENGRIDARRIREKGFRDWTKFCVVCDGVRVWWTRGELDLRHHDFEDREKWWTFKEVVGLGGDRKVDVRKLGRNR